MSEAKILVVGFTIIAIVATIIPLLVSELGLSPNPEDVTGVFGAAISVVNFNFEVPLINLNFNIVPTEFLRDLLTSWFTAWAIIPLPVTLVVIVPLTIGMVYVVIKALPTT